MNEPHVIGIEIINAEKKGVPILIEESNQTPQTVDTATHDYIRWKTKGLPQESLRVV